MYYKLCNMHTTAITMNGYFLYIYEWRRMPHNYVCMTSNGYTIFCVSPVYTDSCVQPVYTYTCITPM